VIETLLVLALVAMFGLGYATRSYTGLFFPGLWLIAAAGAYVENMPTDDEIGALYTAFLVASVAGVVLYVTGVVVGRHTRRR
jgi:hypothetical protein